jgi:hypothetical protein
LNNIKLILCAAKGKNEGLQKEAIEVFRILFKTSTQDDSFQELISKLPSKELKTICEKLIEVSIVSKTIIIGWKY